MEVRRLKLRMSSLERRHLIVLEASSYASTSNASHFLDFGSGDFTVEGWDIWHLSLAHRNSHFRRMSQAGASTGPYQIKVQVGTGNIGFSIGDTDE